MQKATDKHFVDALRFSGLNVLRMPFALLLAVLTTGCQSLYVHDSAIEKSMTDARTGLDNAKINDVFDRQSKYFDQLQAEEIATVKARDAAQRDGQLLMFLTGNEGINGLTLMSNDIDTRLLFLYGPDSDPDHPLWRRIDNMGISASMDQTIQRGYERAVKDYRKGKGTRPTDCVAVLAGLAKGKDDENADTAYAEVKKRCEQIKKARDGEATKAQDTPPPAAPGPGAPPTIEFGAFSFPLNYYVAQKELVTLQDDVMAKKKAADELAKDMDKRKAALEESLATGTTTQQQVEDLVNKIHNALNKAETYLKNPYAKQIISEKLATEIQNIIDATAPVTPAAKPASAAANTQASAATVDAARAAAAGTSTPPPDALRASLALLQAAAGVGDAFSNPPRVPHPNALAVGRAQMSYSRDVANAEVADLEAQVDAARSQLNAITTAVYMLSRAKTEIGELRKNQKVPLGPGQGLTDFLSKPNTSHDAYRHATAALFYYATAWNRGQILADEVEIERNIASRRATMERSRRAANAWMETIKPGLDTLVAYGNGGIDPKTVAQILGGLGLVATGIGVNK